MMTKNEIYKKSCMSCASFTLTTMSVQSAINSRIQLFTEFYDEVSRDMSFYGDDAKDFITTVQSLDRDESQPSNVLVATCCYAKVTGRDVFPFSDKLAKALLILAKKGYEVEYIGTKDYAYKNLVDSINSLSTINVGTIGSIVKSLFRIIPHEDINLNSTKKIQPVQTLVETEENENLDDGADLSNPAVNRMAFNMSIGSNTWTRVSLLEAPKLISGTVLTLDALNNSLNTSCKNNHSGQFLSQIVLDDKAQNDKSLMALAAKLLILAYAPDKSHMCNAFIALSKYAATSNKAMIARPGHISLDDITSTLNKYHVSNWDELLFAAGKIFEFVDATKIDIGETNQDIPYLIDALQGIYNIGGMENVAKKLVEAIALASVTALIEDTANALRIALEGLED